MIGLAAIAPQCSGKLGLAYAGGPAPVRAVGRRISTPIDLADGRTDNTRAWGPDWGNRCRSRISDTL